MQAQHFLLINMAAIHYKRSTTGGRLLSILLLPGRHLTFRICQTWKNINTLRTIAEKLPDHAKIWIKLS